MAASRAATSATAGWLWTCAALDRAARDVREVPRRIRPACRADRRRGRQRAGSGYGFRPGLGRGADGRPRLSAPSGRVATPARGQKPRTAATVSGDGASREQPVDGGAPTEGDRRAGGVTGRVSGPRPAVRRSAEAEEEEDSTERGRSEGRPWTDLRPIARRQPWRRCRPDVGPCSPAS